jgi:hypothetical protein
LSEESFPEERRDQFIYCCKNVCCHYAVLNFVKVCSQADHYRVPGTRRLPGIYQVVVVLC